jgi:hypothetical protein
MITTTTATLLALLLFPVLFLLWIAETEPQRVRRMYATGRYSQRQLAERLGLTRYRVRQHLAAA